MHYTIKKLFIIGITLSLFLFLLVGTYRNLWREANKNIVDFTNTTNKVVNYSSVDYLDTLCLTVLDKVLQLDSINISIVDNPVDFSTIDVSIVGYIQKNPFEQHTYILYVNAGELRDKIEFISHEMVHLIQMENGRLRDYSSFGYNIFDGKLVDLTTPYSERAYEIEAVAGSVSISRSVRKIIYKKFIW